MSACQQPQVSPLVVHQLSSISSAQRRPQAPPFFFLWRSKFKQSIASFRPSIQPHPHTSYLQALWTRAGREIYHVDQLLIFARGTNITLEGQGASHGRGRLSARFFTGDPRLLLGSRPIVQPTDHLPPVTKFHQKKIHHTSLPTQLATSHRFSPTPTERNGYFTFSNLQKKQPKKI